MLYRKFLMKWFCKIDKGSLGADGCLRWLVKKFWSTFTVKIFTNGARSAVDGVSLLRFSPYKILFFWCITAHLMLRLHLIEPNYELLILFCPIQPSLVSIEIAHALNTKTCTFLRRKKAAKERRRQKSCFGLDWNPWPMDREIHEAWPWPPSDKDAFRLQLEVDQATGSNCSLEVNKMLVFSHLWEPKQDNWSDNLNNIWDWQGRGGGASSRAVAYFLSKQRSNPRTDLAFLVLNCCESILVGRWAFF